MKSDSYNYLYNPSIADKNAYNLLMGFPGVESFALSSLGYMWLYKSLDERDDINVYSINTDTKNFIPARIDAISFSLSYEMDFIHVFKIIEELNISVWSKDRKMPLIFAGGPVITSNPAPFEPFFDFFLIGDGEDLLKTVIDKLILYRMREKADILAALSKIDGVYVPTLKNKTNKITHKLSNCVYTPILSPNSYFSNTFIVEVERGCFNRCGFCLASYLNLPVRFAAYEEIINKIEFGLHYTPNIALLGAQISAHPDFNKICRYLISKIDSGENINVNFSSLRVDAITSDVLKLLRLSGQKTFTIAIEAASERLRLLINKNLKENQIIAAVKAASEAGLWGIKFYCMIGLPTEEEKDIKEFIILGKKIKKINKKLDLTFSFSTFIPKPHTPFQWEARENNYTLDKKQKYLTKELAKIGIKSKFTSVKWDYYQTLISRGDVNIASYLYEVYKAGGKLGGYKIAAKKLNIDTDYYVTRKFDYNELLPWDNIKIVHPGKKFLENENRRLMNISGLK